MDENSSLVVLDSRGRTKRFSFFTDLIIGSDRFVALAQNVPMVTMLKKGPTFIFYKLEIVEGEGRLFPVEDQIEVLYLKERLFDTINEIEENTHRPCCIVQ